MSNNRVNDWLNKHFFVKDAKAALVIGLVSLAFAVASFVYLEILRVGDPDCFLNRYGILGDRIIKLVVCLGVAIIMLLLISGLYNLFIRHIRKK